MNRRSILKLIGASSLPFTPNLAWSKPYKHQPKPKAGWDVIVVGAGVFGIWAAEKLHREGKRVAIIDAVHPAHSGASSGGESRVIRSGYGDVEIYTEWASHSLKEWRELSLRAKLPLYHQSGVLWLHKDGDPYVDNSIQLFDKLNIRYQRFNSKELMKRYPVMRTAADEHGLYEPVAGALMARRAVQTLATELQSQGVTFIQDRVKPITVEQAQNGALNSIKTETGTELFAEQFVIACGPWLDKICPQAMTDRLFVTRQEIVYFAGGPRLTELPVWADLPFYGIPSLEGRGFKVADDTHGTYVDPDTLERTLSDTTISNAREFLARRFPSIAENTVSESRVCQYENSSNGDFIIDYHPGMENVLIAGGGSGHGFKHGPAIGNHIAKLMMGIEKPIQRFSLTSKEMIQHRDIQ